MAHTAPMKTRSSRGRQKLLTGMLAGALAAGILATSSPTPSAEARGLSDPSRPGGLCSTPLVTGSLYFDANGNGFWDSDERSVSDVEMRMYQHTMKPEHSSRRVALTTTDASGLFIMHSGTGGYHSVEIYGKLPSGFTAGRTTQSLVLKEGECSTVNFPLTYEANLGEAVDVPNNGNLEAVQWAVDGRFFDIDENRRYHPNQAVQRGEAATFLFRALDPQAEKRDYTPFTDVSNEDPHFDAIAWLVDRDVVRGKANRTFGAGDTITRGEVATILFNLVRPQGYTPPAAPPFSDVPTYHANYIATAWMRDTGISRGYTDGTFRLGAQVTRAEFAAFANRLHHQYPNL